MQKQDMKVNNVHNECKVVHQQSPNYFPVEVHQLDIKQCKQHNQNIDLHRRRKYAPAS